MTPPDRTIMLREQIADALAYNDECGPGLVSRGEYLADADAIIAIVREALLSDEAASALASSIYGQTDVTLLVDEARGAIQAAIRAASTGADRGATRCLTQPKGRSGSDA